MSSHNQHLDNVNDELTGSIMSSSSPTKGVSAEKLYHRGHGGKSAPISVAPQEARRQIIFPTDTIGFLGAPLVDGQNLEGADLAPLAMRDAGVANLVTKLGYKWEDYEDLDFNARYAELGLQRKKEKTSQKQWAEWMASGAHESFSEWSKINIRTPTNKDKKEEDSIVETPSSSKKSSDPYLNIVNAHLIGPALELVYRKALEIVQKERRFLLTVGGDHSIATSTISAVSSVHEDLCIIWIDAHGDANTPDTSPSLHYHGMPAAHIMGWFKKHPAGFEWMPRHKSVNAQNVAYIGLRDIDPEEGRLMRDSDLHIYTMRDVDRLGIAKVIEEALIKVDPNGRRPIHLSLDVDGIDPAVAPGTGTCARGGLTYREIHYICESLALTRRLVSMDLVEINPGLDPSPQEKMHGDNEELGRTTPTVQLGVELVLSALGKTIM